MSHKKTDDEISLMLEERNILLKQISDVKKELKELEKKDKFLKYKIFNGCNHIWVNAPEYYSYDDRYKKCLKCKFIR